MIIRIMKFGGTSVGTPDRVADVLDILSGGQQKNRLCVVVSAFGGVTDQLIRLCQLAEAENPDFRVQFTELRRRHIEFAEKLIREHRPAVLAAIRERMDVLRDLLQGIYLLKELSPKSLDYVMSFGEWLSCYIIAAALREKDVDAEFVDARQLVRTDDQFGAAQVDFDTTNRHISQFAEKSTARVWIVTGFCGSTPRGETSTLGRSGSDYTAAIFGAALNAAEIEIWTDVNGVMSADPRRVKDAFTQNMLTYEEAMEMSHFGAKVIHPPTMLPAMRQDIPIRILNTFDRDFPGTVICRRKPAALPDHRGGRIKGVTSIPAVALLRVEGAGLIGVTGTSMRIFEALARARVNVILITQASSEHSICLAVAPADAEKAREAIAETFELEIQTRRVQPPIVETNLSIVAIVGENMRQTPGISGRLFDALGRSRINVHAIAQGASELNISVVIPAVEESRALNVIHQAFFFPEKRVLNLFMVGTGLIGSTLLEQLHDNTPALRKGSGLEIHLMAVANSKKCLFSESGLPLDGWRTHLDASATTVDLRAFMDKMMAMNLPDSVFVDCTADEAICDVYAEILKRNIAVVTPNKKAASGDLQRYLDIRVAAGLPGTHFFYETNVCAALPVISTLRNLVNTGDRIIKIEAVLSGTLSYIFNTYDGTRSFSEVVRHARSLGYTEPDPREDLNGQDVARKLLILARETGLRQSLADIELEDLLSPACHQAASVEEFFTLLGADEALFAGKLTAAARDNKRLRYIATLDEDGCRVALTAVAADHPFYQLSGSDNIVSFTTGRYSDQPLVIKGPGAGAAVTAAGVFADMLKTAYR